MSPRRGSSLGFDTLRLEGALWLPDVLEKAAAYVGEGVANMLNAFDPEFVVITGVGSLFTQSLMDRVTEEVRKRVLAPLVRDMALLPGMLPAEISPLIGAALVGIESLLVEDLKKV